MGAQISHVALDLHAFACVPGMPSEGLSVLGRGGHQNTLLDGYFAPPHISNVVEGAVDADEECFKRGVLSALIVLDRNDKEVVRKGSRHRKGAPAGQDPWPLGVKGQALHPRRLGLELGEHLLKTSRVRIQ